jgi:hypothetical protein
MPGSIGMAVNGKGHGLFPNECHNEWRCVMAVPSGASLPGLQA